MLSVVCFKWRPRISARAQYGPETVNVLRRMVDRHYGSPHRFLCVTDDAAGLDDGIEAVPLWSDFADLPSPHGGSNPSCYRRLRAFAPDIASVFGERFVMLDLDTVIRGDLSALWDRPEDFVITGDTNPRTPYNGSMMLMTAGARRQVWEQFHPHDSPRLAIKAGYHGSDQAWISYCLGKGEARWGTKDGVYSYRVHLATGQGCPRDARLVLFHGREKPWSPRLQAMPWVKESWQ